MKKVLIGVAVVAVLVVAGGAGAWFYGERQAEQVLKDTLLGPGAAGTISHGALHYSLMDDRIDADAVTVKRTAAGQSLTLAAAHFTVSGVDPVGIRRLFSGGGTRLQDVTASGLVIDTSTGERFEINELAVAGIDPVAAQMAVAGVAAENSSTPALHPFASLTANGIGLTEPTGKASFRSIALSGVTLQPPFPSLRQAGGGYSPEAIEALLTAFSADKASIEDADIQMQEPAQPHVTVHRLETDGIARGRLAAVHVEAFHVLGSDGTDMQLGKLDLANIAFPTDVGVTAETFFAGLVLDKALIEDVDFKLMQDEQPHLTLHRAEIAGVAPGQIASAHVDAFGGSGKDGTQIHLGALDLAKLAYPTGPITRPEAFLAALSLDKGALDDVDIVLPQEAEQPHMSFHHLEIDGLAPGHVDAGTLETLGLATKSGVQFHLGNVSFANIAYRLRGAGASDSLPALRGFFMEKFGITDISGNAPDGLAITLASFEVKMAGTVDVATGFDLSLKELAFDLAKVKDLPLSIDDLGTSKLVLNADARSTYDPKAKVVDVPRYAFVMPDLGSLTMAMRLGNFTAEPGSTDPEVALQRMMAATLQRFEVRYDDASLVPRAMAIMAKQNGETVDQLRKGLVAMLQQRGAVLRGDPALLNMLDAVIAFVQQPKSLTIALEPSPPLAIGEFQQLSALAPAEISKRLGLSVH